MIEGVALGVGFLGAGVIFNRANGTISGFTTAASIWVMAAVGTLAGAGELVLGALITGLVIVVLELERVPALRRFDPESRSRRAVEASVVAGPEAPAK